jgi:hypothetical protein
VTTTDQLMTRREVAELFNVPAVRIREWARNERVALSELPGEDGRPRYDRAEVLALRASGFTGFATPARFRRGRKGK